MLEIVLICACLFLYWYYKIVDVKGPPIYKECWPFVGHAHIILRSNTHELLNDVILTISEDCDRSGGILRCYIGPITFYLVTDPEDVLKIGKSSIDKHKYYQFAKDWFGTGIFITSGSTWTKHKKLLSPGFSLQATSAYITKINMNTRQYLTTLDLKVGKGPFDPSSDIRLTTLKTVFSTLLCTSLENDEDFYKAFMDSLDTTLDCLISRFQTIIYHSTFLYKFSKLRKTEQKALKTANKMVEKIINSRVQTNKFQINDSTEDPLGDHTKSFLDLLLELKDEGKLTTQDVKDEINTTLVAALDTSSWVLNNTLVLLGSHQDVQEKVVNELTRVLGNENRDVDKNDLTNLVYLEAVIKEALRLYPAIPMTARTLEKPVQLSKYTLPEGSNCLISLYGVNHSRWWGEDREVFRPERWFERDDLNNYFAGFSLGRRNCLGKAFAMMSLKTMLAHILRRYRVTADASKLRFKYDFIMKPVAGHFISIEKR